MTLPIWTRRLAVCATLATPLLLAACAGDDAPRSYPQPDFSYLTKLHLNVASIDIDEANPPVKDPRDMGLLAPNKPADVLRAMARDRLLADGNSGRAVFRVETASIVPDHGKLKGTLGVILEVTTSDGTKTGYASASVSRTIDYDNDRPNATRATLDELINQMMSDKDTGMINEFEYQVKRSLRSYMQTGGSLAPAPVVATPVQTETLAPYLTPNLVPPKQ